MIEMIISKIPNSIEFLAFLRSWTNVIFGTIHSLSALPADHTAVVFI